MMMMMMMVLYCTELDRSKSGDSAWLGRYIRNMQVR